jgi:hypothetical protein
VLVGARRAVRVVVNGHRSSLIVSRVRGAQRVAASRAAKDIATQHCGTQPGGRRLSRAVEGHERLNVCVAQGVCALTGK